MIVVGGAFFLMQRRQPAVIAVPTPTPSAEPSPSLRGVVPPSSTPGESESAEPSAAPTSSGVPNREGIWIDTGPMGTPRYGHTAVRLLDGRVLVVGGAGGESDPSTAELYDPVSGTWSATGNMLRFHDGFGATLLRDGKVLVADVKDRSLDDRADWITGAEVYDPASGTWTHTGKMVVHDPGSAVLLRDRTVLVSGEDGSQLYDPATGSWTATGAMVTPRYGGGAPILLPDGRVLVAGGLGLLDNALDSAELYDPATGTWTSTASMHVPKGGARLTLLPNGKVLVTGGSPPVVPPTPPELYDPTTGAWTLTGDYARADARYLSPTLLSDGTVLVVSSHPESLGAEVYDPGTEAWTATGTMLRPHIGVPATLLLDGTVLVAGGSECREGCPSAELYVPAGVSPPTTLAPIPSPTSIPTPSPSPSPVPPSAGPVPPGGWPWTVRVVNRSSSPATLFVADETQEGLLGQLVGRATPNVVAPGTTVKVTFLLPARGVDGWSIYVNPGPDMGGLVGSNDVPLNGEIVITEDGQVGLVEPLVGRHDREHPIPDPARGRHEPQSRSRRRGRSGCHHRLFDRSTVRGRGNFARPGFAHPDYAEHGFHPGIDPDQHAQPGSQHRGGLNSRRPARSRHLQDVAVGHELQ